MRLLLLALVFASLLMTAWLLFSPEPAPSGAAQPDAPNAESPSGSAGITQAGLELADPKLPDLQSVEVGSATKRSEAQVDPQLLGCSKGLAIDKDRRRPVPHAKFRIVGEATDSPIPRERTVVSDSEGRLFFDPPLLEVFGLRQVAGQPSLRLSESPLPAPDSGEDVWHIVLDAAPTIRFELEGAALSAASQLQFAGLSSDRLVWKTAVGHDEFGWWARPPQGSNWLQGIEELAVMDREGYRFASLPALDVQSILDSGLGGPITFSLEATGCVDIDLEIEHRESSGIQLTQHPVSTRLASLERSAKQATFWNLNQRRWLKPGRYLVLATGDFHETFRREIDVLGGLTTKVTGRVELPIQSRTVNLEAFTRDGSPLSSFHIELGLVGDPSKTWSLEHSSWESGLLVSLSSLGYVDASMLDGHGLKLDSGPDRIEQTLPFIPFGPLRAQVLDSGAPLTVTMTGPEEGDLLLQVIQDDPLGPGIGFRLAEVRPGEPMEFQNIALTEAVLASFNWFAATRGLESSVRLGGKIHSGEIWAPIDPTVTVFDWGLTQPGFLPIYGDQDSFVPEGHGRFFARVVPRPGWGTTLVVLDPRGKPVAGARVLVEGEFAGLTNADGEWLLEREERPSSVVVEGPSGESWDHWGPPPPPTPFGTIPFSQPWTEIRLGQRTD